MKQQTFGKDIKLKGKSSILITADNKHILDNFTCGNSYIDKYIKEKCVNDYSMVTRVFVNRANDDVICVYTLSCGSLIIESHGQHYPNPAVEIKIFAVASSYQDIQYSEDKDDGCLSSNLFYLVKEEIIKFTDEFCGANLVYLYSTDIGEPFYRKNDFIDFPELAWIDNNRFLDGCTPLFFRLR